MRKHNGMRPQDIAILLKIISKGKQPWQNKDLAYELSLSPSEISESLNRSKLAGLINFEKKELHKQSLIEFIRYGLHYVFPVSPMGLTNGIGTAHSHPLMKREFASEQKYVWPKAGGKDFGSAIDPLYADVVKAVEKDEKFYALLALTDVFRVGRAREINFAGQLLKDMI
jgi:hypothetical protein